MIRALALTLIAAALLAACQDSVPAGDADAGLDADGPGDGSAGDADAGEDADGLELLECDYPTEGYGVNPDSVLPPFALETCDGAPTTFAALWCGHEVTVVHVSTAWCPLCVDATTLLLRDVMSELDSRRVALVELLIEGAEHEQVATTEDCATWAEQFPSHSAIYIPPNGVVSDNLSDVFHAMPAPSTFLVDGHGVIRFRTTIALPDRVEEQTSQLLGEIEAILWE